MTEVAALPQPGPTDSLHDVPGVRVGQVELGATTEAPAGSTGVTAVVVPGGALGAVDVRGGSPGSRETASLSPRSAGTQVHAVLLVGRSGFGLAAADGAMRELERRGIGIRIEPDDQPTLVVPIVAAAVLFDFAHGDPSVRPGPGDGARAVALALEGAGGRPAAGDAGAGAGAVTGGIVPPRLKGGVGHASLVVPSPVASGRERAPLVVGALVVVNSAGAVADGEGRLWALAPHGSAGPVPDVSRISRARGTRAQTTLAVVATNARLDKAQLGQVAAMAHDGLARAIRPIHTALDGDAVFALAVPDGDGTPAVEVDPWGPAATTTVGTLAADACMLAVLDAMRAASASGGFAALRDLPGAGEGRPTD